MSLIQLVLASGSPRRRSLLEQLGLTFEVDPPDVDESTKAGEPPTSYVQRLAQDKAQVVAARRPSVMVLAADTSVVVDGVILGKPGDSVEENRRMLRLLSNRTHQVMTGVAVAGGERLLSTVVVTDVAMRALTDRELDWYVQTREGSDKAGGYASQGRAGAFIQALNGSSTNVIGLPLSETLALLQEIGLPLPWTQS
jgi:septum formation protein